MVPRLLGVIVAGLLVACSAEAGDDASRSAGTEAVVLTRVDASPLADLEMASIDEDVVSDWERGLPSPRSPQALPMLVKLAGLDGRDSDDATLLALVDGEVNADVLVTSLAKHSVEISILCFVDGGQRPCSADAGGYRIDLEGEAGTYVPIRASADDGSMLSILALVAGDDARPEPASMRLRAFAGKQEQPRAVAELPPHPEVLGGCDVAVLMDSVERRATFTPLLTAARDTPLWLVIERCDAGPEVLYVVGIEDRSGQIHLGGVWGRPLRVEGKTTVIPVDDLPETGAEFQVAVLRTANTNRSALITHALRWSD